MLAGRHGHAGGGPYGRHQSRNDRKALRPSRSDDGPREASEGEDDLKSRAVGDRAQKTRPLNGGSRTFVRSNVAGTTEGAAYRLPPGEEIGQSQNVNGITAPAAFLFS